ARLPRGRTGTFSRTSRYAELVAVHERARAETFQKLGGHGFEIKAPHVRRSDLSQSFVQTRHQSSLSFGRIECAALGGDSPNHIHQRNSSIKHTAHRIRAGRANETIRILSARQEYKTKRMARIEQRKRHQGGAGRRALSGSVTIERKEGLWNRAPD